MVDAVELLPMKVWIESDIAGSQHVMVQHQSEGFKPVTYCTFFYDYRYTSNAQIRDMAERLAIALGASEPVVNLHREYKADK